MLKGKHGKAYPFLCHPQAGGSDWCFFLFRLLGKLAKSEMAYFANRALDLQSVV